MEKIRHSQTNNSGSLLECTEGLLNRHHQKLCDYYGIPLGDPQLLWNKVSSPEKLDNEKVQYQDIPLSFQSKYETFIKSLYPLQKSSTLPFTVKNPQLIDIVSNIMKYYNTNHEQLFRSYMELPSPAPVYLSPQTFEFFLEKFLYHKHDFIKPNALSISFMKRNKPPRLLVSMFNDMMTKRKEYVKMVTLIVQDMKQSGYEISVQNQSLLIYISFYKDVPEISERIEQISKNLESQYGYPVSIEQFPTFDWDIYTHLKSSLPFHIDIYNVLLFHATRHGSEDVIDDVLKNINIGSNDDLLLKPNSETMRILLEYYSSAGLLDPFTNSIDYLINSNILIDIKLINLIIKGLVAAKRTQLAESMLSGFHIQETDDSELLMSKQLSPEDKFAHDKLLQIFKQIQNVTKDDSTFEIIPTENTFIPLISHYCELGRIDKVKIILNIMQSSYKLPITTRIYRDIFQGIMESPCALRDLVEIVSEMLSTHDYTYNLTQDNTIKDFRGQLTPELRSFIDNHLITPDEINIPKDRGNFIKFSDDLMLMIYNTFIAVAEAEQEQQLLVALKEHKEESRALLYNARRSTRFYSRAADKSEIYQNDEVVYLKKGILIDLIDLVDRYHT